jgi:signal transduction histidine kinase
VRVWCERLGDAVRISVRDDGPGIPEEFRARIFEKFSQADASATREKGGTGLGLHIARRFNEHMHGRIGFDSEVGAGSTFWVELPAAPVQVAAETAA